MKLGPQNGHESLSLRKTVSPSRTTGVTIRREYHEVYGTFVTRPSARLSGPASARSGSAGRCERGARTSASRRSAGLLQDPDLPPLSRDRSPQQATTGVGRPLSFGGILACMLTPPDASRVVTHIPRQAFMVRWPDRQYIRRHFSWTTNICAPWKARSVAMATHDAACRRRTQPPPTPPTPPAR